MTQIYTHVNRAEKTEKRPFFRVHVGYNPACDDWTAAIYWRPMKSEGLPGHRVYKHGVDLHCVAPRVIKF